MSGAGLGTPAHDNAVILEQRLAALRNGFEPLPATGKAVLLPGWQRLRVDEEIVRQYDPAHGNTGIRTGAVVAVDIDVLDPAVVDLIEDEAMRLLDPSPLARVGRAPKRLLVYRSDNPTRRKIATPKFTLNGGKAHVELLGFGQQFIAFGIHPDTGEAYRWLGATPEDVPLAKLPVVSEEQLREFLAEAERVIRDAGGVPSGAPVSRATETSSSCGSSNGSLSRQASSGSPPDVESVVDLLYAMDHPPEFSRDDWISAMLAVRGCIVALDAGTEDAARITDAAIAWSAKHYTSEGEGAEREKWDRDWSKRKGHGGWTTLLRHAKSLAPAYVEALALAPFEALIAELPPNAAWTPSELSEDAAALGFAKHHAGQFVFDHDENQWFRFVDEVGWELDADRAIKRAARNYVRGLYLLGKYKPSDEQAAKKIGFSTAIERACQADERMAITRQQWDDDSFLLGVPGGHIDLRTGELHSASPSRFIRRRTAVAPAPSGAPAPLWTRFLDEATGRDADLQSWLQRFAGYALTADVREEIVAFFYGSGGNGKGVFISVLSAIMGDFAYQAPAELFQASGRVNREYQIAKIDGKRLVIASETEAGAAMAEAFVKELSGNEGKINGRHPYGRPYEFRSEAKLLIVGNHAPRLQGRSDAIERRLRVVPFNNKPAQRDDKLKEKLVDEYPAILRWILDGCSAWRQQGLGLCQAIAAASSAYFEEQDSLSQWIQERCTVGAAEKARASDLAADLNSWLRARGEKPTDAKSLKEALARKPGCYWKHTEAGSTLFGLSLRPIGANDLSAMMS